MVGLVRTDVGLEITVAEYGGKPICLIAPRSYADLVSVRVEADGLIENLRLTQVDRWLRPARRTSANVALCVTNEHVYIELDGKIAIGKSAHDIASAVTMAASAKQVMLLFVDQGGGSSADDLIRRYAGRRRCWGALVPVIDSRSPETPPRRYHYLGPTNELVSRALGVASTFVLDSNVLIDMERGYRGRLQSGPLEAIRTAAAHMLFEEVIPGFAIAETMSPLVPDDNRSSPRWAGIEQSLNFWLSFGSTAISHVNELQYRNVEQQVNPVGPVEPFGTGHADRFLDPLFAGVLKIDELRSRVRPIFNARDRLDLFAEYLDWAEETLTFSSGHLAGVAFDSLLAPRFDYVFRLMKFPAPNQPVNSSKRLRNLHGAAWDLLHMRVLDMYAAAERPTVPFLVTADSAFPDIHSRLRRFGPQVREGESNMLGVQGVEFYSRFDARFSPAHEGRFFDMQEQLLVRSSRRISEQTLSDDLDDIRAERWSIVRQQQLDSYRRRHRAQA